MRIAVVGGSIAGLECGINLADEHEVTIFEEHNEIGYPLQCGEGWMSVIEPYGFVTNEIDTLLLRKLDVRHMEVKDVVRYDVRGSMLVIDRPKMEKLMAREAIKRGCEIVVGRKVRIGELVKEYDIVIDASGHPSQYDREFGKKPRGAVGLQARCKLDCEEAIMDVCSAIDGYFWVFPKGDGTANVGVGYWKKKAGWFRLREQLDRYIEFLGGEALWYTGGTIGMGLNRPFVRFVGETPVAMVGDSAGMADPYYGEGMTKAVAAARILAECVENLEDYEPRFMRALGRIYRESMFAYTLRRASLLFPVVKLFRLRSRF